MNRALLVACSYNRIENVKVLLKYGSNFNIKKALEIASGNKDICALLNKYNNL